MASPLKVAVVAAVCVVLLVLSSSQSPAAGQMICSQCDQDCNSSCSGGGGNCGICNIDPSSSDCASCRQAYYYKCMNYCGAYCRSNCVNG
uniref:Kazal-like domain-containing protein n=1 Tax=Oryza punctata TaxID=4537 RepID=A0A0E0MM46_ORYPU